MLVVRPAKRGDLASLMELALLSGGGFTSLPDDEAVLASRLALSEASFSGEVAPAEAWYTLMLEDITTGRIEGVAGVRAAIGIKRPHFSFRVMTLAQYSSAIDTRFDHRALVLVNECGGWTEVGSLFLRAERRNGGAGALLARARYMLIGTEPLLFSSTILAELRGWFDENDRSPFWDGVASKFYRLPFEDADRMVTSTDGQFILDLAPRHPIYVELIADDAQAAIGAVHRDGVGALKLLEREGFVRSGLIDIFDGGPTMTCDRDRLATIQQCITRRAEIATDLDGAPRLMASGRIAGFRAVRARAVVRDHLVIIEDGIADALQLRGGDAIRVAQ